MGVLDVHDLIADVVGRLHEVDERVPCVFVFVEADHAEVLRNLHEILLLALEEAEFLLLGADIVRFVRVFHDGGDGGVGEDEPALPSSVELVRQETEGVGVSLKVDDIVPLTIGQPILAFQLLPFPFGEVGGDGGLPGVPERRVAHVVRQAAG